MTELKELIQDIQNILESGEDYAREAVKHKHQYPDLASTYARIAQDDLAHVDMLHKHAVSMLEDYQRNDGEAHAAMKAVWDYAHGQQIEKTADVKRMLDMYRM